MSGHIVAETTAGDASIEARPARTIALTAAGLGSLVAAVAAVSGSLLGNRYDAPLYAPQVRPRISYTEGRRLKRASTVLSLSAQPVPLKHMHSAARRRALVADGALERQEHTAEPNGMNPPPLPLGELATALRGEGK